MVGSMKTIGLTGGIGSGKSTVAAQLIDAGFTVVDADQLARDVVAPGSPVLAELAQEFGADILDDKGTLKRQLLAQRAFASEEKTARLNAITHPAIADLKQERFDAAERAGARVVIYDMPLLIEQGLDKEMDLTVVVHTDREVRLDRLQHSRGLDPSDARRRMDAQVGDKTRLAAADVVIDNSGTLDELRTQVDELVARIRSLAAQG